MGLFGPKNAVIPAGTTEIESFAFEKKHIESVSIPNTVRTIGAWAFTHCTHLREVVIPDSVMVIERSAFSECYALERAVLPKGLTVIEESVFSDCKNLWEVILPDGLTTIRESAFWDCKSLKDLVLPDGLTTIEKKAFWNCLSLERATVPDSVSSIAEDAFEYGHPTFVCSEGSYAHEYAKKHGFDVKFSAEKKTRGNEEAARQEAARKAAEEAARQEAERKAAEEAARQEAARKATEEAARQEAARKAAEEAARQRAARKAAAEAARKEEERKAAAEAVRQETERKAAKGALSKVQGRSVDISAIPERGYSLILCSDPQKSRALAKQLLAQDERLGGGIHPLFERSRLGTFGKKNEAEFAMQEIVEGYRMVRRRSASKPWELSNRILELITRFEKYSPELLSASILDYRLSELSDQQKAILSTIALMEAHCYNYVLCDAMFGLDMKSGKDQRLAFEMVRELLTKSALPSPVPKASRVTYITAIPEENIRTVLRPRSRYAALDKYYDAGFREYEARLFVVREDGLVELDRKELYKASEAEYGEKLDALRQQTREAVRIAAEGRRLEALKMLREPIDYFISEAFLAYYEISNGSSAGGEEIPESERKMGLGYLEQARNFKDEAGHRAKYLYGMRLLDSIETIDTSTEEGKSEAIDELQSVDFWLRSAEKGKYALSHYGLALINARYDGTYSDRLEGPTEDTMELVYDWRLSKEIYGESHVRKLGEAYQETKKGEYRRALIDLMFFYPHEVSEALGLTKN